MKLLLSGICIVLLGLFAYQVMSFQQDLDGSYDTQIINTDNDLSQSLKFELPELASLKDLDKYSEIIDRPLFLKNRLPAQSLQTSREDLSANELEHLVLIGTVNSTEVQIGIVANPKEKEIERLKIGQTYNKWKIAEISREFMVFHNKDIEYKLFITPIRQQQNGSNRKESRLIGKTSGKPSNRNSYERWASSSKKNPQNSQRKDSHQKDSKKNNSKQSKNFAGRSYNYKKKSEKNTANKKSANNNSASNKSESTKKSARRSPIKIPTENAEEKDAAYYEALDEELEDFDEEEDLQLQSALDDYDFDEDFSEEDLRLLKTLGIEIYDD